MSPAKRKIQGCARSLVWTFAALLITSPAAWAGVSVSLTAPANGTSYVPPVNIPLSASASASGGYTVSKVEFFYGTTLIGTDTSSPYSIAWNNAPSGQHVLTAKATAIKKNSPDQTATSSAVNVTVNAPPVVTITSPAGLTSYTIPPPNITVTASASDSDGTITKVEFLDCGLTTVLATVTTPPYNFVWNLPPPYWEVWADGTVLYSAYAIIARATDNLGGVALSGEFCTTAYVTPTVTLTAPANGASFNAPATVNLTAALGPSDGPIRKMQFYNGTTLLGEATTAPYTFTWQNVQAGTYSLSARSIWGKEENPQEVSSPVNIINVTAAQAQLHYIHVDHLNTPRLVANQQGQTVWRWDQQEPFGVNPADENPSGLGAFDLPLRLPGQYFDKETNLHYNYFRDYDPSLGIYKQSDLIGLDGGINTYAYAYGSPLSNFDASGLFVEIKCRLLAPAGRFISRQIFGRPQRHCFLYVGCPEEDWATVLSVQGNIWPLPVFSTGRKVQASPLSPVEGDDPFSPAVQTVPVTPKNPGCVPCGYEKEIITKFNRIPSGNIPYDELGPNSNTFVNYLATSSTFGATVPYSSIPNAPGLSDSPPNAWR